MWERVSRKLLQNLPRNEVGGGNFPILPPGTSPLPGLRMVFSDLADHSLPTYPGQNHRQSKHTDQAGLNRGFTFLKDASTPLGAIQNSSVPPTPVAYFPDLEGKIPQGQREAIPEGRHPNFTGHPPGPRRAWGATCGQGPRRVLHRSSRLSICTLKRQV